MAKERQQFNLPFGIYAYQGVELPDKYARLHPKYWRSQWLLEEKNAELKRILIQGIGYDRICQEFKAIELDRWQQYRLLKIDSSIDDEPVLDTPDLARWHSTARYVKDFSLWKAYILKNTLLILILRSQR
jgi:hypothetical protein